LIMWQPSRTTQKTYSKRKDATVHWTLTWQGLPCTQIPSPAVTVWHPRSVVRCTGRLCVSYCTPSTQWSSLQLENHDQPYIAHTISASENDGFRRLVLI
jgi:hypothetical protein